MGGFLGIGHSSAKTDRGQTLKGYGDLSQVFNFALPTGEAAFSSSQEALGKSGAYWANLLSGNRTAMTQAAGPEINAVNTASDAARKQAGAMGTARGGGTGAGNQKAETDRMAQIDNYLMGVRPEAAKEEARVGTVEGAQALNAMGLGESSATNLTAISADSRKTSIEANNQIVSQITGMIESALLA